MNNENKIFSITTDGGSNVRSAVENVYKMSRIWCGAHRFHLVICNGLFLWKKLKKNKTYINVNNGDVEGDSFIQTHEQIVSSHPSMEVGNQAESKQIILIS